MRAGTAPKLISGAAMRMRGSFLGLLFSPAAAQGTPFACCYGGGNMEYGFCQAPWAGVSTWRELQGCWANAAKHFSNTTIVGEYNLTAAEKYSIFQVIIDDSATEIAADPGDPPLTFDADLIPDGAIPELGYLPFEMGIVLPWSQSGCPTFALRDVSVVFTLHHQQPRDASRVYTPLTFSISGCGRDEQLLQNLSVSALGYANLELSFVTLRDSHNILSIDQPGLDGGGGEALTFNEAVLLNSTLRYFGDVSGNLGMTGGLTQNGSRAIGTRFLAADPREYVPEYAYRPVGQRHQFGWYGAFPQEWGNGTLGFTHLEDSYVQYLYDVQVGSSNVTNCTFDGWFDPANPAFAPWAANSTALPPSVDFYNMESLQRPLWPGSGGAVVGTVESLRHPRRLAPQERTMSRLHRGGGRERLRRDEKRDLQHASPSAEAARRGERTTYGCNVSDSIVHYAWDVDLLRSAVSRTTFRWAAQGMPIPAAWAKSPPVNPSFWINLLTYEEGAGFEQSVNDSLVCMRPKLEGVAQQNATIENGTAVFRTPFAHTDESLCSRRLGSRPERRRVSLRDVV